MKQIQGIAAVGLVVAVTCGAEVWATPPSAQPIFTNKSRFRIPYRYDGAELARIGAAEIRLYVSADEGLHWQHAQSVSPSDGKFEFVAPGEGEYWFAVRTLDRNNRLYPPQGEFSPGLKVVVDSTPPSIQLTLDEPEPGRVRLSWRASDPHLDPSRLKLEYRQGDSDLWQAVRVRRTAQGETSWSVADGGVVAVRGSVADLASNVAHAERQIRVKPVSHRVPEPEVPDFSEPIARQEETGTGERTIPESFATTARMTSNQVERGTYTVRPHEAGGGGWPTISHRNSVQSDRFAAPETDPTGRAAPSQVTDDDLASGARVVNTTRFRIGYQVDQVGPSGVGAVELYITQNGGSKWWKYGEDSDRKSPIEVEVPGDGVYGFAIRVRSGAGLAARPPQPGEKPSIVVLVDRTPPEVELSSARQGEGTSYNRVLIRWHLSDANPARKSVSLSYSTAVDGPWKPITDWQQDTGSYQWTVDERVPGKVYISVAARDRAGNVTRTVSSEPVIVDLKRPTARIVEVEPDDGFRR